MSNAIFNKLISKYLKILPSRFKEVICRRYGIDSNVYTLEAIGGKMGITRERVRQIEEAALKKLASSPNKEIVAPIVDWAYNHLSLVGGVRTEKDFFNEASQVLFPNIKADKAKNFFSLALTASSDKFQYLPENKDLEKGWYLKKEDKEKALEFLKYAEKEVKNYSRPLPPVDFSALIREAALRHGIDSETVALAHLNFSKKFGLNILGEFGLNNWDEINPRGVREKAYLIFRREKKPLHFVELSKIINGVSDWPKKVHYQTIHNELIKDPRFILIGRGIYALKEWGYEAGTVSEIVKKILQQKGALPPTEIINLVKEQRIIRENTILLNLQNKNLFVRLADGSYGLKGGKKRYKIQEV